MQILYNLENRHYNKNPWDNFFQGFFIFIVILPNILINPLENAIIFCFFNDIIVLFENNRVFKLTFSVFWCIISLERFEVFLLVPGDGFAGMASNVSFFIFSNIVVGVSFIISYILNLNVFKSCSKTAFNIL